MSDFLPAGRTPPLVLLSSESAAARASMGGWCRPCGVTGTVLWACQSCWRKHETPWCSASVSWHRSAPSRDLPVSALSLTAPSVHDLWITSPAAVDRLSWLWLEVNGRTCLWTGPSQPPATAAPCAQNRWFFYYALFRWSHAFLSSHGNTNIYVWWFFSELKKAVAKVINLDSVQERCIK